MRHEMKMLLIVMGLALGASTITACGEGEEGMAPPEGYGNQSQEGGSRDQGTGGSMGSEDSM